MLVNVKITIHQEKKWRDTFRLSLRVLCLQSNISTAESVPNCFWGSRMSARLALSISMGDEWISKPVCGLFFHGSVTPHLRFPHACCSPNFAVHSIRIVNVMDKIWIGYVDVNRTFCCDIADQSDTQTFGKGAIVWYRPWNLIADKNTNKVTLFLCLST